MIALLRLYRIAAFATAVALLAPTARADETPTPLTLEQAQQIALAQSPTLRAADANASAAKQVVSERRADYLPQVSADMTAVTVNDPSSEVRHNGVEQQLSSYITAGALNTSTLMNRTAAGVQVKQLIADFGKTGGRMDSASAAYRAGREHVRGVRADVLFAVTQAYFETLQAQATVRIAQQTFDDRRLEQERIALLAKNKLKSELDVSFAQVAVEQSRVLLLKARNDLEAATAQLAFAMGYRDDTPRRFALADTGPAATPPARDMAPLVYQAVHTRPELAQQRALCDATVSAARASRADGYPTLSLLAAAGNTFSGDDRLPDKYAAIGLNLNIPLFAGGRYNAGAREAEYRADAERDRLTDLENSVVKEVRVAWLDAKAGFQALSASERLRSYAEKALELAQSRYHLGLSSIVELNSAQLGAIDAEIKNVQARYEYKIALARLAWRAGALEAPTTIR